MKMKDLLPAWLVIVTVLGTIGCNNNKKGTGIDDEAGSGPVATTVESQEKPSPMAFLWPGNWFRSDEQAKEPEPEPQPAAMEEEGKKPDGLALLWPGNWFKGDAQEAQAQEPEPVVVEEEKKKPDGLARLWPGNWFGGDKSQEDEGVQPVQYYDPEAEKKPDGLARLWPGNWFKGGDDKPKPVSADDILDDMAPEMKGIAETDGEYRIRRARAANTNKRQLRDDIELLLMRERPSRLSLFPIP